MALLKERYESSHKMRERSYSFAIWILGYGIAISWVLLNNSNLKRFEQMLFTVFILAIGYLTYNFIWAIDKGSENNRNVMIKLEESLGCYHKSAFIENETIYPEKYRDPSYKATSHFNLLYKWIFSVSLFVLMIIWKTDIIWFFRLVACKQ